MSATKRVLTLVTLLLFPAAAAVAQEQQPSPAGARDSSQAAERALRSRVFEIKHRDPRQLVNVLFPLGSSIKAATMSHNEEFRTITVRDYPEVLATVEEAIRRLDVPEPARPGIEFHVHILIANNSDAGQSSARFPAELENVLKQLRTTLNYKNYYLMTSQVIQARDQAARGVSSKGVAELRLSADTAASKNPIFYEFSLQRLELETPPAGAAVIQIGDFGFSMKVPLLVGAQGQLQYQDIGFHTPVRIREGEKVVVGTTSMEDKGIVVVLTGSITK